MDKWCQKTYNVAGLKNNSNNASTGKQEAMVALTNILTAAEALCQLLDKKKITEI